MLIGRNNEQKQLLKALNTKEPEFIAITGRRRVGKTFLIRQTYKDYITFEIIGIQDASSKEQLANFYFALRQYFDETLYQIKKPKTWQEAFETLISLLEKNNTKKQVVFFDEMPWLASSNSSFLRGLSFFWNSWASKNNIVLVACGSATSWIVKKLILNKGGLHNRVTKQIILHPFTLSETKLYLQTEAIKLNNYQIIQLYLIIGGIPYYLKLISKGKSVAQIINILFFEKNALLKNEFENLYAALFLNSDNYIKIITACYQKWQGINHTELTEFTGFSSGGTLSKMIKDLEMSSFIQITYPINKKTKDTIFRLIDEFSIFYLKFIKSSAQTDWQTLSKTPSITIWQGFAFENLCFKHIESIKKKLGISGVNSRIYSFRENGKDGKKGTQIDLIIDRDDAIVNLCEIKFYNKEFIINKSYNEELEHKIFSLQQVLPKNKTIHLTMITTFGVKENKYSNMVQSEIIIDDLFN